MLKAILFMAGKWITGLIYGQDKAEAHNGMQFLWSMLLLFWLGALIGAIVANDDPVFRIGSIIYLVGLPAIIYFLSRKSKGT